MYYPLLVNDDKEIQCIFVNEFNLFFVGIQNVQLQGQLQQLLKEINEKNKTITDLQNEIQTLSKDKYTLRMKLETMKGQSDSDMDGICEKVGACNCNQDENLFYGFQATCKRQRRELEIVRNEFKHLESENNSLKSKVQVCNII